MITLPWNTAPPRGVRSAPESSECRGSVSRVHLVAGWEPVEGVDVSGERRGLTLAVLALAVVAGGPGPAALQEASPAPTPPLRLGIEEEVDVQFVLVDFLALDAKQRTVPDLTADELTLLVGGREVEVASLDRDCPGGSIPEPRAAWLDQKRDYAETTQPRKIVLVFDYYHMSNASETYDMVFSMLDKLPSDTHDEHMVVTIGQVVRIETPFTSDVGEVRWAIERMRNDPDLYAGNHSRLTEWPFFERVEVLFDLMEQIEGRKTMVLYSGPFASDGFAHDPAYKKLSAMSTIARTSIYPIDTGGLRTLLDPGNRPLGGPIELRRLANETGGRMTADTNDLGLAYARARRDMSCTYTLGFYDSSPRLDDRRRLTIRTDRAGVRITYPEFYVIRSSETKRKSLFHTASMTPHLFESDEMRTELFLFGPRSTRRWAGVVAIELHLPPGEIVEEGEQWLLKGLVRKRNGTIMRSFKRRVSMPAANGSDPQRNVVKLFESLTIPPGDYIVSAVLSDPGADTPRAATRAVAVSPVPRGAPFVVGPILGRTADGPPGHGAIDDFEPLLTLEATQGEPLDSLTLVCVAGADAEIDVHSIAREITTFEGVGALAFDRTSTRLPGRGKVHCHEVLDRVATDSLAPGRYELSARTETADHVTGTASVEFTIVPGKLE